MNPERLYNFRSTFTGTHFVSPRAYQVQVRVGLPPITSGSNVILVRGAMVKLLPSIVAPELAGDCFL